MSTVITIKGQITIPKQIRDALGLEPGTRLDFAVNADGDVVLQRADEQARERPDRFSAARGKADVKWSTRELMSMLRGEP